MNMKFKKVYQVAQKANKPRIWLQHIVCEAAGLQPGEPLYIKVNEDNEQIIIQNHTFDEGVEDRTVHVSSRKNRVSGKERPLVDTAGDIYSFLDCKQKVEVTVYKEGNRSKIVVQPLQYSLFENSTLPTPKDDRLRLLSVCSGAGMGTACATDTQYFIPVQEIELEDDSASVLLHNFPNSSVYNGDLRDIQEIYEADVAMVTMPCNEHSSLGFSDGNIMNDLSIAVSKIIKSSKAPVLFFENVPSFYKSNTWEMLKELLIDEYPYWSEKNIEAWDFGSIALRNRTYVVAMKDEDLFNSFQFPVQPKGRRRKLKDFLDSSKVTHEWKSLEKWMNSFNSRSAWKDRDLSRTFVDKDADKLSCIPARYTGHSASSSYVLGEDNKSWRFLSIEEIRRILSIPSWFEFPDHIQKIRRYELLGQGVDGAVIKAIANQIAYAFMKVRTVYKNAVKAVTEAYNVNTKGQIEMLIF